ncbi:MAG: ferrochelatase [Planctomycetes bacterium]|nr:ferrochelatase [Planctomycetota bacterium]
MRSERIGILISQLGTPEAPDAPSLRRYLREFLGDPRVIEANRALWWLILNVLLVTRPKKSAAMYRRIWTEEGSPLLTITLSQARKLEEAIGEERVKAAVGMRYGNPSLRSAIEELCRWGAGRILLFPMYPQYAGATTASTYDEALRWLPRRRVVPALRVVPPYYGDPAYLSALARVADESLAPLSWRPDLVLLSFHGVPRRYVESGDPYRDQVEHTARRLEEFFQGRGLKTRLVFQSRFGREPWLEPYADVTLKRLGKEGAGRIAAMTPGFTADCLETIDEIGMLGLEQFREGGGELLHRIPCLNDHPAWIEGMKQIALRELSGWL